MSVMLCKFFTEDNRQHCVQTAGLCVHHNRDSAICSWKDIHPTSCYYRNFNTVRNLIPPGREGDNNSWTQRKPFASFGSIVPRRWTREGWPRCRSASRKRPGKYHLQREEVHRQSVSCLPVSSATSLGMPTIPHLNSCTTL